MIEIKMKVDIINKDTTFKACSIHIHFGDLSSSCKSLIIKTMDGNEISYDLKYLSLENSNDVYNWASNFNLKKQKMKFKK